MRGQVSTEGGAFAALGKWNGKDRTLLGGWRVDFTTPSAVLLSSTTCRRCLAQRITVFGTGVTKTCTIHQQLRSIPLVCPVERQRELDQPLAGKKHPEPFGTGGPH